MTANGGVKCWGHRAHGRLGNRSSGNGNTYYPVSVYAGSSGSELLSDIVQVDIGYGHACAVTSGGGVKCWGRGQAGALGNRSTNNKNYPVSVRAGSTGSDFLSNIVQVDVGYAYACAVTSGGGVKCWGNGSSGRLGNRSTNNKDYPVSVRAGSTGSDFFERYCSSECWRWPKLCRDLGGWGQMLGIWQFWGGWATAQLAVKLSRFGVCR